MAARRWLCLACLLATVGSARAQQAAASAEELFNALWFKRMLVQRAGYKLYVVEMRGPAPRVSGSLNINLRLVADLTSADKSFEPQDAQVRVRVDGARRLSNRPGGKRHLALMRSYVSGEQKRWSITYLRPVTKRSSARHYYLMSIDGYGDGLWKAVKDLVLQRPVDGRADPAGRFDRMLRYITGKDPQVRDLAACYAGANGWEYKDDPATRRQPDAFARVMLDAKEPKVRGWMARAYSAAGADLLPRDPDLLRRVLGHKEEDVYTPALKYGLRHASARAEALAGAIRSRLDGPKCQAERRCLVLKALTGWGEHARPFVPQLEAIARGKAKPPATELDRVTALRLCLDAGCDDADRLVLDTLEAVPSAVGLKYAVDHKLYALVPAVIGSVRKGRLAWTDVHSAALVLLTRRFPDGTYESFDAWWSALEKTGRADAAVRDGFADPTARTRARKLIARLSSPRYKVREAARAQLKKLGWAAAEELESASRSADPEVAASVSQALDAAKARFKDSADRLEAAAKAERQGRSFLPMANGFQTESVETLKIRLEGRN
ncbi:MAG: hypothetical protein ACYS5V_06550 [Planctomycetota bacterium]